MQKLMSELSRLYLPEGACTPQQLEQRFRGDSTGPVSLAAADGQSRALVIDFKKSPDGDETEHWDLLCAVANAMQTELGLPAPAVSISGLDGYGLWLSLQTPAPAGRIRTFASLLHAAYFPSMKAAEPSALAELPPCLHPQSGKWAAFINPGLGASFAGEPGLDMPPPLAGQVALLDKLHSIGAGQLEQAIAQLQQSQPVAAAPVQPVAAAPVQPAVASLPPRTGLLLADATIEDIVRHLHAKNIEPSFRYLIDGK